MADYRTNLTNEVINEVRKFFANKVYQTVIPRNIRLTEAPGFGKPIEFYDKNSIGAIKYREFVMELLGDKKEIINKEIGIKSNNTIQSNELEEINQKEVKT